MSKIVEHARGWLGTPYKHQHSVKGLGTDCLGLIRGVYRELIGEEPEVIPNYSPSWDEAAKKEEMLGAFRKHLVEIENSGEFKAGDVLVFRMRPQAAAKHCAVVSSGEKIIHAQHGRVVEEVYIHPHWDKRGMIVGRFNFPGVV